MKAAADKYREEFKDRDPEPFKGTDSHLRWVMRAMAWVKQQEKLVDNSSSGTGVSIAPEVTVTPEVIVKKSPHKPPITITPQVTVSKMITVSTVTPEVIGEGFVILQNNWFRLDCDIIGLMSQISDLEFKIYLFLVNLSYGQWKPKNICSASLSAIAEGIGAKATPPISRNIKSLITKGLVLRIFRGDKKGDPSIYRVFLPSEVPWYGGKTKVRLLPEK